jgi:hypothetical protein
MCPASLGVIARKCGPPRSCCTTFDEETADGVTWETAPRSSWPANEQAIQSFARRPNCHPRRPCEAHSREAGEGRGPRWRRRSALSEQTTNGFTRRRASRGGVVPASPSCHPGRARLAPHEAKNRRDPGPTQKSDWRRRISSICVSPMWVEVRQRTSNAKSHPLVRGHGAPRHVTPRPT